VAPQTNATAGTVTRRFFASRAATADWLECHATTVAPGGSSHAPSLQIDEEVIVVEEGQVEAYLNEAWKSVSIGSVVFNAANTTCALRNVGNTSAKYYVYLAHAESQLKISFGSGHASSDCADCPGNGQACVDEPYGF
jgi:XRE family transcriptional regulator, regulator of sulfur utilization